MYIITKEFELCYGHRVWTQQLESELAGDISCKCRHLHGHQGKIIIKLSAYDLEKGMVTDFHHLNWFKEWVDTYFDHKMIIDEADPLLPYLLYEKHSHPKHPLDGENEDWLRLTYDTTIVWTPIVSEVLLVEEPSFFEMLEGLVVINKIPTSENLARLFSNVVAIELEKRMKPEDVKRIQVMSVEFKETPKTSSIYAGGY